MLAAGQGFELVTNLIRKTEVPSGQLVDLPLQVEEVEAVADGGRERRPLHRCDPFPVEIIAQSGKLHIFDPRNPSDSIN